MSDKYIVKIGDFGMSKDVYTNNYYRENGEGKARPVKWMALESIRDGKYSTETEVVSK